MSANETERILCLLERRFPAPEWAAFRELPDGTGGAMRRRFDFYALNTWPSKSFRSVVVEVKVSRADFRRELAHREKREPAEQRANECYFAFLSGLLDGYVAEALIPDAQAGRIETWDGLGEKAQALLWGTDSVETFTGLALRALEAGRL